MPLSTVPKSRCFLHLLGPFSMHDPKIPIIPHPPEVPIIIPDPNRPMPAIIAAVISGAPLRVRAESSGFLLRKREVSVLMA